MQSSQQQDQWLRVNPLEEPKLNVSTLPKHQPARFQEYIEIYNSSNEIIGFRLPNQQNKQFMFDQDQGWKDEFGCYYDADGKPNGWFVLNDKLENKEHFYDIDGIYVPTDQEKEDYEDYADSADYESDSFQDEKKQFPKNFKEYDDDDDYNDDLVDEYEEGLKAQFDDQSKNDDRDEYGSQEYSDEFDDVKQKEDFQKEEVINQQTQLEKNKQE